MKEQAANSANYSMRKFLGDSLEENRRTDRIIDLKNLKGF